MTFHNWNLVWKSVLHFSSVSKGHTNASRKFLGVTTFFRQHAISLCGGWSIETFYSFLIIPAWLYDFLEFQMEITVIKVQLLPVIRWENGPANDLILQTTAEFFFMQ